MRNRLLRIYQIQSKIEKNAQQIPLPGVITSQIDLPMPLELENLSDKDRYNLLENNFNEISHYENSIKSDIKKIIHYELKNNPTVSKQQIIDFIVLRAKNDSKKLIQDYISKIPKLRAHIDYNSPQLNLPGVTPDIRFLPAQEEIEESKEKLNNDFITSVRDYEDRIEEYKKNHNGEEPLPNQINYRRDPRKQDSYYSHNKIPTSKDVTLDLTLVSNKQYKENLKKLYIVYNEISRKHSELDALYDSLEKIESTTEPSEPNPKQFSSYNDMVKDLKERTIFGIQSVIKNSMGYTLFGMVAPRHTSNRRSNETAIFSKREDEWLNDPEKMKEFLEKIPKFYDSKDNFWNNNDYVHTGTNINDTTYWFNEKYNAMLQYDKSLAVAKESFAKGTRWFKDIDKKLSSNINKFLEKDAFKFSSYIESTPEHKAKLDEIYLTIVKKINDTSRVLARHGYHSNNGLYTSDTHQRYGYDNVDIGAMLHSKKPQFEMISSLTKLLVSSIYQVQREINKNEIGPFLQKLSDEIYTIFLKEQLNISIEDFPVENVQLYSGSTEIESKIVFGSKKVMNIAEAWLKFATNAKLTKNYQSIIKYPEFIYRGEPENIKFFVEAMKERLGYAASQILVDKLHSIIFNEISSITSSPIFIYAGQQKLREEILSKKLELFTNIREQLFNLEFDMMGSFIHNVSKDFEVPRYNDIKNLLVQSIQKIKNINEPLRFQIPERFHVKETYGEDGEINIVNADKVAENFLRDTLYNNFSNGNKPIFYFLISSIVQLLKQKFLARIAVLPNFAQDKFISSQIQYRVRYLDSRGSDLMEVIEILKSFLLPTELIDIQDVVDDNKPHYKYILLQGIHTTDQELYDFAMATSKLQQFYNKEINDEIQTAINNLLKLNTMCIKMMTEKSLARIFEKRMRSFGGAGPNAISNKIQELNKQDKFKHLPLIDMAKVTNDETIKNIKEDPNARRDLVDILYLNLKEDTNQSVALATISHTIKIREPQQLFNLFKIIQANISNSGNLSGEEIKLIFPLIITSINSIDTQIEIAKKFASFIHNNGTKLSKDIIINILKNPNFKDWINEVDAAEKLFDIYVKIKQLGGPTKIFKENKPTIDSLVKTKSINSGITRRLQLVISTFETGTRINPSIEGFDSIKKLLSQTNYDLNAIEQYATFAKYNNKIEEQKLYKDPLLFKLNWNMPDKKFRFRVLKTFDPYHFQVGIDTNCCQKLGGAGEDAAIDSYINPFAGVVLLEIMIDNEYKTAAQSYFHYVPKDNGIILDNVEAASIRDDISRITGYTIDEIYAWWAKIKQNELQYKYFLCGTGYNKLSNDQYEKQKSVKNDPRSFKHSDKYSDWTPSKSINLLNTYFKLPEEAKTIGIKKRKAKKSNV